VSTFLNFLSPRSFTYSPKTIGTEFLAYREKIEVTGYGLDMCELYPVPVGLVHHLPTSVRMVEFTTLALNSPW
jgi:hypothetical protein